jgi:hypothetical protein
MSISFGTIRDVADRDAELLGMVEPVYVVVPDDRRSKDHKLYFRDFKKALRYERYINIEKPASREEEEEDVEEDQDAYNENVKEAQEEDEPQDEDEQQEEAEDEEEEQEKEEEEEDDEDEDVQNSDSDESVGDESEVHDSIGEEEGEEATLPYEPAEPKGGADQEEQEVDQEPPNKPFVFPVHPSTRPLSPVPEELPLPPPTPSQSRS